MIQIEEIKIQNVRGIRYLTLSPNFKPYAIQGPNGTGKSGVVDAFEFALTGTISRLVGDGTSNVSLKKHGPHIDFVDKPESAWVELKVHLTSLDTPATIKRNFKSPEKPILDPDTSDVRAAFAEIEKHPEIALTRRQITKFIYSTGTKRSKDIEKLLQLDRVNAARAAMKSAKKASERDFQNAETQFKNACAAFQRQLEIDKFDSEPILNCINSKRQQLKLERLETLSPTTSFIDGTAESPKQGDIVKATVEGDIHAFNDSIRTEGYYSIIETIRLNVEKIEQNPGLQLAVKQKQLVSLGMDLLDAAQCPLCEQAWDLEELRSHLDQKKKALAEAEKVSTSIEVAAQTLKQILTTISLNAQRLVEHAKSLKLTDEAIAIANYRISLESTSKLLVSTERIISVSADLADNVQCPVVVASAVDALLTKTKSTPDASAIVAVRQFLFEAERRMQSVRDANQARQLKTKVAKMANVTYAAYVDAAETVLTALYEDVKDDFVEFYRAINQDDENEFSANINADEGKIDLDVDFYSRGHFPPNALHSEGHQDTMGLCLYLALMRKLLGEAFRFVVLDDVVMSVDNSHRYQLCNMLKTKFPNTQFFITTHEKVWYQRMQDTKLIESGQGTVFQRWNVADGPKVEDAATAWEEIDAEVDRNKIEAAAFLLRRHLESVMPQIVEQLGGSLRFRLSQNYCGGEMVDAAISRYKKLLGIAAKSSNNLKCIETVKALTALLEQFASSEQQKHVENWAINTAIHFNPWADFVREDFIPVVNAFKKLLKCFECNQCGTCLYVVPKPGLPGEKESLRCSCNALNFNLKQTTNVRRKRNPPKLPHTNEQQKDLFAKTNPKESSN